MRVVRLQRNDNDYLCTAECVRECAIHVFINMRIRLI